MTGETVTGITPEEIQKLLNEATAPILAKIGELEKSNESIVAAQADLKKMNEAMDDKVKQMNSAKDKLDAFEKQQNESAATTKKEATRKLLNEANRVPEVFDKLYPEIEKDPIKWMNENQDKVFHPVPETKLGGKGMDQGIPDAKELAHDALRKVGA